MNRAQARAELGRIARELAAAGAPDPDVRLLERAGDAPSPGLVAILLLEGARVVLREAAA